MLRVVRCPSCDGYGWSEDDFSGQAADCDWCGGVGYVYRRPDSTDQPIPRADLDSLSEILEALELERLREMGYSGTAKRPWEQEVRRGTRGGQNPYEQDAEADA
ncbi:MAG: hypothetical protein NZ750_02350 [Anaerolineae bacterium]|nr:hypothetical protein [Anaerolineae bacterium]MDW8173479.1 hypothetical protein [Anaerolineae bacterium]